MCSGFGALLHLLLGTAAVSATRTSESYLGTAGSQSEAAGHLAGQDEVWGLGGRCGEQLAGGTGQASGNAGPMPQFLWGEDGEYAVVVITTAWITGARGPRSPSPQVSGLSRLLFCFILCSFLWGFLCISGWSLGRVSQGVGGRPGFRGFGASGFFETGITPHFRGSHWGDRPGPRAQGQ